MGRAAATLQVNRKSGIEGYPDLTVKVSNTPARVYLSLVKAGSEGITCRDWHGYDLRHHLRVLRNKGIGIDREWEKHEGGQHGRWRLKPGHSHKEILIPKEKPAMVATKRALNSKSNGQVSEVLND